MGDGVYIDEAKRSEGTGLLDNWTTLLIHPKNLMLLLQNSEFDWDEELFQWRLIVDHQFRSLVTTK